jgi:hypothetical protein
MDKVTNMSAHAELTPAVLREKASRARAYALHLPAYDEAVERLFDFAAELEARADSLGTPGGLHPRSTCDGRQEVEGSEA